MKYAIVNTCGGTWRLEECRVIEIDDRSFEKLMETGGEKWWHFEDNITALHKFNAPEEEV